MKELIVCLGILIISTQVVWGKELNVIEICAVEASGLMEKNGTGMWNDLLNKIFTVNSIVVKVSYEPYMRCENRLRNKEVDAVPGVYPESHFLIPKRYLGIDLITVIYKKGKITKWNGQETLRNKVVSWRRGYKMDKHGIITVPIQKHEYSTQKAAIMMLLADRIDFLLDYQPEIGITIKELNASDQIDTLDYIIKGGEYYVGFSKTSKGEKLRKIFDKEMEKLYQSGELHKMFETIGDPSY